MKYSKNEEQGVILLIILIAVCAMTAIVLTTSSSVGSSVKIANNYSKTVGTFNLAEVGIAKARQMLEGQAFDTVLATYSQGYLISPTNFGTMGTYEVTVADDAKDGSVSTTDDTNGIIKVTSVGRNAQGGKVTIQTHLQLINTVTPVSFPPDPSSCGQASCDSAAIFCGVQSEIGVTGAAYTIDGADYTIPPYGCSGSGCNGTVNAATNGNWDVIGEGTVTTPSGVTKKESLGSTNSSCTYWQTFYNQWASVSASAPGVVMVTGSSYSVSNSCSSPKIFLINSTSPTVTFSGYQCGMFIVASDTSLSLAAGTNTIVGTILAMGNYSNVGYVGTTGTSNFMGKLIFKSTTVDAQKEFQLKGNASLKFSSAGEAAALQAINNANAGGGSGGTGTLITASWEEIY